MIFALIFELPAVWWFGVPLAILLGFVAWRQHRRGVAPNRIAVLFALRCLPVALLLFLAARPMRISREWVGRGSRPVVVLVDRSKSMSVKESEASRYARAVDFLSRRLLPALKSADLPVQGMAFDDTAESLTGSQIASAKPEGKHTNLGGAIAQALNGPQKPLTVIALTDGVANDSHDDQRAMALLSDSGVPFIGVGFGSDEGMETLSLDRIEAPQTVPPKTGFTVSAQLELINSQQVVNADLLLFRDGQMLQKKSLKLGTGSRTWIEGFQVSEAAQGQHTYNLQLLTPDLPNLKCINTQASASVRVSDESELRVLYVQGALTWDFKFINLALHDDPTIKLTGLTRTSQKSVFRQNVESTTELVNGFPASLQELSPYRVVVLANVRPEDLSQQQQELLGRFCGELGGGILMIGGSATFDQTWQHSQLEKLLPVVFSSAPIPTGPESEFHIELSPAALQHPLFRLSDDKPVQTVWAGLPGFTQFGRVESAKKGAQVWMWRPTQGDPTGRRILMASQQYGAGQSAVLCLQNLWRWRLAKGTDPLQFDRFWLQLFRWLGEAGRQQVNIQVANQELRPDKDIQVSLSRQTGAQFSAQTNAQFIVQVEDSQKRVVQQEGLDLPPGQDVEFRFHPDKAGLYTLAVLDSSKTPVASRAVDIRDTDVELEQTARNMETLSHWAAVSDGLAFKVEECPQAADLVAQIKTKVEQVRRSQQTRHAVGLNAWTFGVILACLSGEWLLRKRWAMI